LNENFLIMEFYFVRHASASDIAARDAARELTNEGRQEARVAGKALVKLGAKPAHIFSSPLVRARQTAEILGKELDSKVETLDELLNDTSTSRLLNAIKLADDAKEIILVGHMPSLAGHVAHLIGAVKGEGLAFGKGSIALVEIKELNTGGGKLRWLVRQKQLRELVS
jgi:phosphohistidine phosphatase